VSIGFQGKSEGPSESKVRNFDIVVLVY
jgi:hypothetical protein